MDLMRYPTVAKREIATTYKFHLDLTNYAPIEHELEANTVMMEYLEDHGLEWHFIEGKVDFSKLDGDKKIYLCTCRVWYTKYIDQEVIDRI